MIFLADKRRSNLVTKIVKKIGNEDYLEVMNYFALKDKVVHY
jgi:hypothetical protein